MLEFENLNQLYIGMSQELLKNGVWEETRGHRCLKLPYPVTIRITNPSDRYITIKERKWNKILPFAESLWLALGLNDLDKLPGQYVRNLYNFSDDGRTWRAAYSPRMRFWEGYNRDYDISEKPDKREIVLAELNKTDQYRFVIETLKKDKYSRQAGITIHDPAKDDFDGTGNLKQTKDQPCTRLLHFQVNDGALDLTVFMRSNDILWGATAINVFNFTLIQEYISNILRIPVGKYYHIANNFHVYEDFIDKIKSVSRLNIDDYKSKYFYYYSYDNQYFSSLQDFDDKIDELYAFVQLLQRGKDIPLPYFGHYMIDDWATVFYNYHKGNEYSFNNPLLNQLFYGDN